MLQILNPFMLRRMKCEVDVDVPPKRELLVYAPMTQPQQTMYRSVVDSTIRKLVDSDDVQVQEGFDEIRIDLAFSIIFV